MAWRGVARRSSGEIAFGDGGTRSRTWNTRHVSRQATTIFFVFGFIRFRGASVVWSVAAAAAMAAASGSGIAAADDERRWDRFRRQPSAGGNAAVGVARRWAAARVGATDLRARGRRTSNGARDTRPSAVGTRVAAIPRSIAITRIARIGRRGASVISVAAEFNQVVRLAIWPIQKRGGGTRARAQAASVREGDKINCPKSKFTTP